MKTRNLVLGLVGLFALLLLAGACEGPLPPGKRPNWQPQRVAVLPFQAVTPDPHRGGVAASPLTGAVYSGSKGKMAPGASSTLTQALMDILAKKAGFALVPPDQAGTVFIRLEREMMGRPLAEIVALTGKRLNADAVLVGYVYRYRELVGGSMAASQPASVAFDLSMVRVADQAVVWKNSFDQTQRPLTENILKVGQYLEHGMRWFTVKQFARIGMDQLMRSFPWFAQPVAGPSGE